MNKLSHYLTRAMELVCIIAAIIGKISFYEFIVCVTLLDILYCLEKREADE